MNTQFEQWVNEHPVYSKNPMYVYEHLQANPHLLREDGEKEPDMEQEARALCEKYKLLFTGRVLAALTEFGKMWYEKGRDSFWVAEKQLRETRNSYHDLSEKLKVKVSELQQQLAEKDEEIKKWHGGHVSLYSELSAAKERLEEKDAVIDLASANIAEYKKQIAILEKQQLIMESQLEDYRNQNS